MLGRSIQLFKLFGFAVKIDASWPIIAFLVSWSLATQMFPASYPGLSTAMYWQMAVIGAIGLFLSIVLHEFGHALVARRCGVEMRGITLFIFGGVAEMKDEPPNPKSEFLIAIGGPAVTVVIATLSLVGGILGDLAGWPVGLRGVIAYLAAINVILLVFNMIPAFPLDGGRVLRAILWSIKGNLKWATRITASLGSVFGMVLIGLGLASLITGNIVGGMWWTLLGFFLRNAARMSYQHVLINQVLEGEPVEHFMTDHLIAVPPNLTLDRFVKDYVYRHHHKMFPVTSDGTLMGCVTTRRLKSLPRNEWPRHTVEEMAEPCSEENTISSDSEATVALKKMRTSGTSPLMVVDDGHLRGMVSLQDMLKVISLKVELEEA